MIIQKYVSSKRNLDEAIGNFPDSARNQPMDIRMASYQSFLNAEDENRLAKILNKFKAAQKEYNKISKERRELLNDEIKYKNFSYFV